MSNNWEDRLAPVAQSLPAAPKGKQNWEDRLQGLARADPAQGGSTLKIGPFDTGMPLSEGVANFLAGTGKVMVDTARGVGQKLGAVSAADIAEARKLDEPLMATSGGRWGNVVGQAVTSLPLAWVPGANTMKGAALVGAAYNALQPAVDLRDWVSNTAEGGAGGALGNAAGRVIGAGYGAVKGMVRPFFQSGRQSIIAEMLHRFEPDTGRALQGLATNAGELVPGSLPTAAEAANTVGLSRLEKALKQNDGSAAQMFLDRTNQQNAARVAAINNTIAGQPGQRAALESARDSIADGMYTAARQKGIDPAALTPEAQANIAAFQQRLPADVLERAQTIARLKGQPMNDASSLSGMHWVKQGLDSKIAEAANDSTLKGAYTGLKNDMLTGMDAMSPMYGTARKVYAAMSEPLDRMDVGQILHNKLVPALNDFGASGGLNANAFANAVRNGDQIAQQVTGIPTKRLADVLTPKQMQTLDSVGNDLARSANNVSNAKAAGSDTVQNAISQQILDSVIGPLGAPLSLTNNALLQSLLRPAQWAASTAEPMLMREVSQAMLNPAQAARLMARPKIDPKLLGDGLRRLGTAEGSGMAAVPWSEFQ